MINHFCCCGKVRLRMGVRIVGWSISLFALAMLVLAIYFWFFEKNLVMLITCSSMAFIYLPAVVAFFCMTCTSRFDSVLQRKFFRATIMFATVLQLTAGILLEAFCLMMTYYMNKTNEFYRLGFYIFLIYSISLIFLMAFSLLFNCIFLKIATRYITLGH